MGRIVIIILLIVGGLFAIVYLWPKFKNKSTEIKYMQTKKISELREAFNQMQQSGLEQSYREYVELKGAAVSDQPIQTPFSNQPAVYCESKLSQVTSERERYQDSEGNWHERTNRRENVISDEKSSQYIYLKDSSGDEKVTIELSASGCSLDIQQTFDRFEPRNNLSNYSFFNTFSFSPFGSETLGFRMTERVIRPNQQMYILGEAFLSGDEIHIGTPTDHGKPFIVTTKSEDDLVNATGRNAVLALAGGIAAIVVGVLMIIF